MARSYDDAMRRVKRALLAVPAAALLLGGCAGGGGHDIVVGQVGRADVKEIVEAPATVVARASARVTSPASGTIARLSVKEGQRVRAGQLLLEIDSPDAQEQLAQAEQAHDAALSGAAVSVPPADLSQTQNATDAAATAAFVQDRRAAEQIPDKATREALLAQVGQSQAAYAAHARTRMLRSDGSMRDWAAFRLPSAHCQLRSAHRRRQRC